MSVVRVSVRRVLRAERVARWDWVWEVRSVRVACLLGMMG